jgi:hypothetical protein
MDRPGHLTGPGVLGPLDLGGQIRHPLQRRHPVSFRHAPTLYVISIC